MGKYIAILSSWREVMRDEGGGFSNKLVQLVEVLTEVGMETGAGGSWPTLLHSVLAKSQPM